jgi:hypothetical protein
LQDDIGRFADENKALLDLLASTPMEGGAAEEGAMMDVVVGGGGDGGDGGPL